MPRSRVRSTVPVFVAALVVLALAICLGLAKLGQSDLLGSARAAGGGEGPVAAYSFDEGEGTTAEDETGNGHTATIEGAAWTKGRYGSGLEFGPEGGDVLTIPDSEDLRFTEGEFTLEAWVRPREEHFWTPIIDKRTSEYFSYAFYVGGKEKGRAGRLYRKPDLDRRRGSRQRRPPSSRLVPRRPDRRRRPPPPLRKRSARRHRPRLRSPNQRRRAANRRRHPRRRTRTRILRRPDRRGPPLRPPARRRRSRRRHGDPDRDRAERPGSRLRLRRERRHHRRRCLRQRTRSDDRRRRMGQRQLRLGPPLRRRRRHPRQGPRRPRLRLLRRI